MAEHTILYVDDTGLREALALIEVRTPHVKGWLVEGEGGVQTLKFMWGWPGNNAANPFPVKMPIVGLIFMIENWLKDADYPEQPRCDGSITKGFRIASGYQAVKDLYCTFSVRPAWIEYHK